MQIYIVSVTCFMEEIYKYMLYLLHVSWKKYTNICCIHEKINKVKPALIVAGNEGADETEKILATALRCYLLDAQ